MRHVVFFSGGIASWMAARILRDAQPDVAPILLFCDTLAEDADLYRFLSDAANDLGCDLVRIAEGRTPWQVFRDVRFLGNPRVAPCSRILKTEVAKRWLQDNAASDDTCLYFGYDWSEEHRLVRSRALWHPWQVEAPLISLTAPLTKSDMIQRARQRGLRVPRLYESGFQHNNCGGLCVKAGQAHWRILWLRMPDRYREAEAREEELRTLLGKDVAILRDRRDGVTVPLSLREFRRRLERDEPADLLDWGACGCLSEEVPGIPAE